ncbi:hypothetical protein [Faecalibacillus faecis]
MTKKQEYKDDFVIDISSAEKESLLTDKEIDKLFEEIIGNPTIDSSK